MVLRPGHHKRIHIDTGEADEPCVQAAVGDHLLHLDNDPATGVMGGLRLGQGLGVVAAGGHVSKVACGGGAAEAKGAVEHQDIVAAGEGGGGAEGGAVAVPVVMP